ncbi:hypothetical protein GBA52_001069 [Prunus armeniaca]|nr:hypothetical protein GBA52_001069 [Prunus armeniaca]
MTTIAISTMVFRCNPHYTSTTALIFSLGDSLMVYVWSKDQDLADQGSLSLSNVTYTGVRGTSAVQNAITLNCAASTNCTNIRMSHVNITSWASGTHQVSANGTSSCTTPAVPCLHHYIEKMKILYFNQNAYGD